MHIQCTKKLIDLLKVDIIEKNTDEDIFAWHANYIVVGRKKMLVLVHDLTRFCVVIYGIKKSDMKNFVKIVKDTMYVAMKSEAYGGFMIKYYLDQFESITFGKTKDRIQVSRLNKTTENIGYILSDVGYYIDSIDQPQLTTEMNRFLFSSKNEKGYKQPNLEMLKILEEFEKTQTICNLDDDYYNNIC